MCKTRILTVLMVMGAVMLVPVSVEVVAGYFGKTGNAGAHFWCLFFASFWVSSEIGDGDKGVRKSAVQVAHAAIIPLFAVLLAWGATAAYIAAGLT